MRSPSFYGGDGSDLGHVRRLSPNTFKAFVDQVLNLAATLNVTQEQYAALPKEERQRLKRVPYVVPCTFEAASSRRLVELARTVTIVCLDIDEGQLAAPYYSSPETLAEQLMPFNWAIYTTASSVPTAPRVRIFVEADHLPVARYREAVADVARRIGLPKVNWESCVVHQPMYLPTLFKGQANHPLLWAETDGRAYAVTDIHASDGSPQQGNGTKDDSATAHGDDLEYLRPALDDITLQDVASALKHLDPDCSYGEWLEVAAALRHQFPREPDASRAYALFDEWSSMGTKYVGEEDTLAKWRSLSPSPRGRAPVTIRSVLHRAANNGWDARGAKARCYAATLRWLKEQAALNDKEPAHFVQLALQRIAATPLLSSSEEEALLQEMMTQARRRGMKVGLPAIRKDLRRMKSATQAERKAKERLPGWCKGLAYVGKINQFVRPATGEQLSPEAVDRMFGNKLLPSEEQLKEMGDSSIGIRGRPLLAPQDYLLNIAQIPTAYDLVYDPRQPNDVFIHDGGRAYVNTYIRNYPEPDPLEIDAAAQVFNEHMERLIGEPEYRRTIIDFMAHIVQRPGQKIRWALLLQGTEGCGKTFLAEALSAVLGAGHVRPVDSEALRGQWNDWAYGSQLVALEEVRVAGQNRYEVMNHLKPLITNPTVCINQRFRDSRTVANTANYMLFTNHHDALVVGNGDRRYYVVKSALQTKAQVLALPPGYFERLFGMLKERAGGLRAYFERHEISADFPTDGPAPVTKYLEQLVADSASDATAMVREVLEDSLHPLVRTDLLSSSLLIQILEGNGITKVTPQYLASILRDEGYVRCGRYTLGEAKHPLWAHTDSGIHLADAAKLAHQRMQGGGGENLL